MCLSSQGKLHGLFTEFCKHDPGCCGNETSFDPPKLAVPISNFVSECQAMWVTLFPQMLKDAKTIGTNHCASLPSCEGKSYSRKTRRIVSSEDLGVVLMGTLKICPTSGRFQLVDATGSMDVVIPDLLSNGNVGKLYEVKDYRLVLEGLPVQIDPLRVPESESFSCRSIFQRVPPRRELNHLTIYAHFYLRSATCLNVCLSLPSCRDILDDFKPISGGIYHLLLVTHKLPATQNFQETLNTPNKSSLFAEAIVLPCNLFLNRANGDSQPLKFPKGNLKAPLHYAEVKDDTQKSWFKRQKIAHALNGTEPCSYRNSLEVVGKEKYELQIKKKHSDLCSPPEIPCFIAVRIDNDEGLLLPGILFCVNNNAADNVVDKPNAQKVLLEFGSESFNMYQLLQIGMYYAVKCANEELSCNLKDHTEYANCDKVLVTSQAPLWSLSFTSVEVLQQSEPPQECLSVASSVGNNEQPFGNSPGDDVLFHRSINPISDVNQCFSVEVTCLLSEGIKSLEDGLVKPLAMSGEPVSVTTCIQTIIEAPRQPSGPSVFEWRLPEGNLISLYGNVLDVHGYGYAADTKSHLNSKRICNINQRVFQEVPSGVCIHVYDDHHMVKICGTVTKHAYPIGFGPGVHATFHRVLMTGTPGRQCQLMLTTVSFIVVNSIKEVNHHFNDRGFIPPSYSETLEEKLFDLVSSGLISQLMIHCLGNKPVRFRCRVAAVYILLLGTHTCRPEEPISEQPPRQPTVSVPLGGFILDDGSSLCCCWADGERAMTLLRLYDTDGAFSSRCRSLNRMGSNKTQSTTCYHLEKMLKKHQRITVKNLGAMLDSSCLDFTFSANSNQFFSSSDESLLKFIFLNACRGSVLNIVGSVMDSNAIRRLERKLAAMQVTVHSIQNIWASDVWYIDPLAEARNMVQELTNRIKKKRKEERSNFVNFYF
eukprot:TRINITY_DN10165_c0_g1_i3.p1 TRINITY_DN10165_c0_g1~~TRINITY_DN10165_c0_g1_i3.p1  ORF type:complete len:932 (+),score=150.58 TRINITY_DN10165_c0_g1_i3:434-3229(+)